MSAPAASEAVVVVARFAALQIEREERDLAASATRSYPAQRRHSEPDCGPVDCRDRGYRRIT